jgi:N-acetylated-alpha-linked acidic dipeptidase
VHWYQKVVGDDYEPAIMLTRVLNLVTARLADSHLLPLNPVRYANDTKVHLQTLAERAEQLNVGLDTSELTQRIDKYERFAKLVMDRVNAKVADESLGADSLAAINHQLVHVERDWLRPKSDQPEAPEMDSRPWFRNLFAASDPDSGYAAWMLPALRHAVESKDAAAVSQAIGTYRSVFDRLEARLTTIQAILDGKPSPESHP